MLDRKRRILYIENANSVGGSTIGLYRLVQNLDRARYEPVVLFHRPNGYEPRFRQLGVEVVVLSRDRAGTPQRRVPRSPARRRDIAAGLGQYSLRLARGYRQLKQIYLLGTQTLPEAWQIRRFIVSHGIDLVHLNNRLSSNRSGALAARLAHTACLCHVRDFDTPAWFDRWVATSIDRFAFMSRALEQNLRTAMPTLRGSVVYDGLELGSFLGTERPRSIRAELGLGEDDFVVGNVGRLVPWKGQEVFIQALDHVASKVPNLKALIVGEPDPPTEESYFQHLLRQTQALGLADKVLFAGFRQDIPAVMSSLDLLVHSSLSPEPFGLVVIEGMAAGRPVIATGAGGVLDIISHGQNGLLVPAGDAQAMAESILTLARDRDLAARLAAKARECVAARFTVTLYVQTIEDIYRSLL